MIGDIHFKLIGSAFILLGVLSAAAMIYYLLITIGEVKPNQKRTVDFIAPIALFMPQFWTAKGNHARMRLMFSVIAFVGCFYGAAYFSR
jgi:hypothetical protein